MKIKLIAKSLLKRTPFYPVRIGFYIRNLHFQKYLRRLPVESFTEILDAGCGRGLYAIKLAQRFPWLKVIGMDIKMRNFQSNHPSNFFFKKGDLLALDDRNTYDFIYCIDVLEHIPNNDRVLRNFYRVLKNKGYLYLHMPYDVGKKRIFTDRGLNKYIERLQHIHSGKQYTLNEMVLLLQEIGFKIIITEHTFAFLGDLAWELDRMTDKKIIVKIFLMPLLKILGQVDARLKHKEGSVLVLAQKLDV